ncbi:hypothetical protein ACIBAG_04530 [Streptomyces sp. NPDC051243]|uniref:hypothetical protein n=1 Tax=Streptomyces sp. NPDC051243 TaxID=3365646 RepID=UPI0037A9128A
MFNGKKIAAVSGLLGGLAMTWIGVTPAHAAANPGACAPDNQGNIVCTQRIVGEIPEGGEFTVRRSVTCQPTEPVTLPAAGLLNSGTTRIGPHITCSDMQRPTMPAPVANSNTNDGSDAGHLGALARIIGGPGA